MLQKYCNVFNRKCRIFCQNQVETEQEKRVMHKKPPAHKQGSFLYQDLLEQLNPKDPLLILAKNIPWESFERDFASMYSLVGRPAKPVRLMVGLLLLKQLENLSDERIVEAWARNPYYQAFCGMQYFQWTLPCDPTDLVPFRKRIGATGMEKIFQASVALHGEKALEPEVVVDTTVQEKAIAFPTDTRLRVKIIGRCWKIARAEKLSLRRSYRRELREKLRVIRFGKKDKRITAAAMRWVKIMAAALLRDIERKLPVNRRVALQDELALYRRTLSQTRKDKDKSYSLHEPDVLCISKGKEHKKYEFGAKAALAMTKESCLLVGARSFSRNVYDGDTLDELLPQIQRIRGQSPEFAICDRGFRGRVQVDSTKILLPGVPPPGATDYAKRKTRSHFRRRSAIEPVIGHLKSDFRLARNYLKGVSGDAMNLLLAAAAFNFRKWMAALAHGFLFVLLFLCGLSHQKDCKALA